LLAATRFGALHRPAPTPNTTPVTRRLASTDADVLAAPDLPFSRRVVLCRWSDRQRVRGSGTMSACRAGYRSSMRAVAVAASRVSSL